MQIKLHEWHLGMTRHIPTLPAMFVDVLDTPPRSLPDHRMNITDDHEGSADVCRAAQARCRLGRIATKAELAAPRSPSAAAGPQHVVGIVDLGLGRVADPSVDGDDLLVGIQSEGQQSYARVRAYRRLRGRSTRVLSDARELANDQQVPSPRSTWGPAGLGPRLDPSDAGGHRRGFPGGRAWPCRAHAG